MCKCVLRFCKKWATRPHMRRGLFTFTQMKKVRSPIYHPSTSQRTQATCPPHSTRTSPLHFELVLSPPILPFLFSGVMATQTPRGRAYTDSEVDSLLDTIESILPRCANHWENVRITHASYYPDLGRTTESLKRKFAMLYNSKKPTGDPTCPLQVRRAKRAWEDIKASMDIGVDDDRMSVRGDGNGNEAEDTEDNLEADASDRPALPSRSVGDTDDTSSTHTDSASFPRQMSTSRVFRSNARQRSMQQSSHFMEMMQMMVARDDAGLERQMQQHMEMMMMMMMMMTVVHTE